MVGDVIGDVVGDVVDDVVGDVVGDVVLFTSNCSACTCALTAARGSPLSSGVWLRRSGDN